MQWTAGVPSSTSCASRYSGWISPFPPPGGCFWPPLPLFCITLPLFHILGITSFHYSALNVWWGLRQPSRRPWSSFHKRGTSPRFFHYPILDKDYSTSEEALVSVTSSVLPYWRPLSYLQCKDLFRPAKTTETRVCESKQNSESKAKA